MGVDPVVAEHQSFFAFSKRRHPRVDRTLAHPFNREGTARSAEFHPALTNFGLASAEPPAPRLLQKINLKPYR